MSITETIPSLGSVPTTTEPSTFDARADTLLGTALPAMVAAENVWAGQANALALVVNADSLSAAASALTAIAAGNAVVWVSGATFTVGMGRYSPITGLSYRCIADNTGTTDPSADSTNWVPLNPDNAVNNIGSTGGGTQDINLSLGRLVNLTVDTSANTFTFSNPTASGTFDGFVLNVTNGGSQTVNYPSSVDFVAGAAPALTAAGIDTLVFLTWDGGTVWFCFVVGQAVA